MTGRLFEVTVSSRSIVSRAGPWYAVRQVRNWLTIITLPSDLERRIQAAVQDGRFASVDDAMAEAARLLLRDLDLRQRTGPPGNTTDPGPDLFLGCMRDDAELMDEIVADAYRLRREESWREIDL
jgi:hypothetical protein